MPVYVDNARKRYGRMIMSHMYATTALELFQMADKIGVDRKHFQNHRIPHFDICQSMRKKACEFGAFQVTTRQLIQIHRDRPLTYREKQKAKIHSTHELSEERTEILAPAGTCRFYGVRNCLKCEAMMAEHPAGLFIDEELFEPCIKESYKCIRKR